MDRSEDHGADTGAKEGWTEDMMVRLMLLAGVVALVGTAAFAQCSSCGTSSMAVAGAEAGQASNALQPFTPETRFMSLCGFARWLHRSETGVWLSRCEAAKERGFIANCDECVLMSSKSGKKPAPKAACPLPSFKAETNFMSCCGYSRWKHYKETGVWLSRQDACQMARQ